MTFSPSFPDAPLDPSSRVPVEQAIPYGPVGASPVTAERPGGPTVDRAVSTNEPADPDAPDSAGGFWTLAPETMVLLEHPWFGTAPTVNVPTPVEAFSLDATGPLAWWWAPASTMPFRVREVDHPAAWNDRLARCPTTLDGCFSQLEAWLERPLIWREHEGTVQAVLLGTLRATFSEDCPEGRLEQGHPLEGWIPCDTKTVEALLRALRSVVHYGSSGSMAQWRERSLWSVLRHLLAQVAQQTARAVQRTGGARRLTVWRHDAGEVMLGLDPVPFCSEPWALWPSSPRASSSKMVSTQGTWSPREDRVRLDALAGRLDERVQALVRVLAHRFPLWTIGRRQDLNDSTLLGPSSVLKGWDARVREHPNADLLVNWAIGRSLRPTPYVWQEALWVPNLLPRPAVWRYALRGPRSNVRCLLGWRRTDDDAVTLHALTALATLPEGQRALPTALLRIVPQEAWRRAYDELRQDPTSDSWPVRLLRAFLHAAGQSSWVARRQRLIDWSLLAQQTFDWAVSLDECPMDDPSWTWATLMDRFSTYDRGFDPEWTGPLRAGHALGGRITPILSTAQAHLVGTTMGNCLKEASGRRYLRDARNGMGVLYRLDRNGKRSVLALDWSPDGYGWVETDHGSTFNSTPDPGLMAMAETLRRFHQQFLLPGHPLHNVQEEQERIDAAWARATRGVLADDDERFDDALLALVDPTWHLQDRPVQSVWRNGWLAWSAFVDDVGNFEGDDVKGMVIMTIMLLVICFAASFLAHFIIA